MTIRLTPFRCLALVAILAAVGAARPKSEVQRFATVIGVKPEKLEYYKQLHANPWPRVNQALKEANVRNYSIYLTQFDDGKWYLFSYLEYTGSDFDADMKKMAAIDELKRWWKETGPCQTPLENRKDDEWWKALEEVYHLD